MPLKSSVLLKNVTFIFLLSNGLAFWKLFQEILVQLNNNQLRKWKVTRIEIIFNSEFYRIA